MLKKVQYHLKTTAVYPGIYQPRDEKGLGLRRKSTKTPVNIIEFPDYYQIEMPAPGFKNDEFFITSHGCSLFIAGRKRAAAKNNDACYRLHGFDYDYISRKIDLPTDADTDFGTAEYKNGVLYVYLYKTGFPVQKYHNFIIVY